MTSSNTQKILVVFYSRTGQTREIAAGIARHCGAEVEELHDVAQRSGLFGYLRSAREALRKTAGAIHEPVKLASDYEVVVLGTPVWAGHISSPLRGFLARQSLPLKHVAFFCTMGGRGADNVFAELSQLTGCEPVATLAMTNAEIAQRRYDGRLAEFAAKLMQRDMKTDVSIEHTRLASVY